MNKYLLILPGAADPNYLDEEYNYKKRYKIVSDEAYKRGYTKVELLPWVGQKSGPKGIMNLKTASKQLKDKIKHLEGIGKPYDIIAFSWGANVYLKTLFDISEPNFLKRTVLWGIDEYWRMAKYFATPKDIEDTINYLKVKGTIIKQDFMSFEVSNELLISDYKYKNKILIAFGENDNKSLSSFAEYLKSFVKSKPNICYQIIANVEHVVTEYNREYLNCLFGEIC